MTLSPAVVRGLRAGAGLAITVGLLALLIAWHPAGLYDWLKAFHVIAVIAWMAGMLYLPRLFVYHCEAEPGSRQSETFKVMERRLLRAIINPAMVATWVLGLWLAFDGGFLKAGWLHGKLVLVLILSGIHGFLTRAVRDFADDIAKRPDNGGLLQPKLRRRTTWTIRCHVDSQ